MKIEKRNNHKKKIVIGGVIITTALVVGILATSYSKYRITESIKLGEGIINYSSADFELVGMYLINEDNTETKIDVVPGDGYILNGEKTQCTVNNTEISASIEYKDNKLYFGDITSKGTKCKVYFEKKVNASDTILKNVTVKPGATSFTGPATTAEDSGVFTTLDDDGTTYYYRGIYESLNNWVDFAGFKWRIIRINGDGSIRMIYNGTDYNQTGTGTQIGTMAFNSLSNSMHVGFRYTSGEVHGTETPSTILGADNSADLATLNGWYNTKIKGTKYEQYIDQNAGFCNDRSLSSGTGLGNTTTQYMAYSRIYNLIPTMKCNNEDLFTVNISDKGNQSLVNPIGLITADEVVFAGGNSGIGNVNQWLYTNQNYWTMTPSIYNGMGGGARLFGILIGYGGIYISDGSKEYNNDGKVGNAYGVRPVINLRSDINLTGSGTISNPFKISGL